MGLASFLKSFRSKSSRLPSSRRRPSLMLEHLEERVVLSGTELYLDFGTLTSPVQVGYARGTALAFKASTGYGWVATSDLKAFDRAVGDPLARDFVSGTNHTFRATMANGWYEVSVTSGDTKAGHPAFRIDAEGVLAATIPALAKGQFVTQSFAVNLTDGDLRLRFDSLGASTTRFTLNGLVIRPLVVSANAGPDRAASEGQSIQFSGQGFGAPALTYAWNFGDGGTASGISPTHAFADQGIFQVVLTVTDGRGLTQTDTAVVTVSNVAPTASFTNGGAVTQGNDGAVSFSNPFDPSSTDNAAGFRYSYDFDNDGIYDVIDSLSASATVPASYLSVPGARIVKGRISDKDGGSTSYTTSIMVVSAIPPTATFANGGAVNEASTGAVSFSNPSGGSGGYTYSFDFNNDGTFEITGSANASATVPSSYLNDGPGARVVRGRIADSTGSFRDYTTSITINNVAPSVTLASQFTGTTGVAINFSSSVSDVSTVDTAAGFTYLWEFGDGATSTQATPSHGFTTAGTYTITLTVWDKDNGQTVRTSQAIVSNASSGTTFPNNVVVPPLSAPTGTVVNVSTVSQLQNAVANLQSGVTIMIAPGTYNLTGSLYVPQNRTNVAIRGATGNRNDVVIRGNGMAGSIPFGIWVGNVNGVTIADLTIRDVRDDGIILNAGTQSPLIHNVRLLDIGDQMIKANPDGAGGGVDNGILQYSVMEYSAGWAPDYYVAGLDIHTADNWLIQYNTFKDFRQQSGATQVTHPALLVWNDSRNTRVLWNTFINNDRDISLGLYNASGNNPALPDQQGGRIEGNMIYREAATLGDVAIFVTGPNTQIYHNTYYDASGFYAYAIEYRFTSTTNVDIKNNLLNRAIRARDGATGTVANNLTTAQASWFINAAIGDLHLKSTATLAINQIAALSAGLADYDGQSRPTAGTNADYGADEYVP